MRVRHPPATLEISKLITQPFHTSMSDCKFARLLRHSLALPPSLSASDRQRHTHTHREHPMWRDQVRGHAISAQLQLMVEDEGEGVVGRCPIHSSDGCEKPNQLGGHFRGFATRTRMQAKCHYTTLMDVTNPPWKAKRCED